MEKTEEKAGEYIEKARLLLEIDQLRINNILLSEGVQPKEVKKIENIYSSGDEFKQQMISFLKSKKEMLIAMDEFVSYVKNLK